MCIHMFWYLPLTRIKPVRRACLYVIDNIPLRILK